MIIERRIKINNINYFVGIDLKYTKEGHISKIDGSYFDLGDLSIAISYLEDNYSKNIKYDEKISYMNDVIYIYDNFRFLSYIKDISFDKNNEIYQIGYISKEEIIQYIKNNKIDLNR